MSDISLTQFIDDIKKIITDRNLSQALERMINYLQFNLPNLYNDLILITAQYNGLIKNQRKGVITREQFEVDQNRISEALLGLLDELPRKVSNNLLPINIQVESNSIVEAMPQNIVTEKILGINNLKQISWLEMSIKASKSVCRILTPNGLGTGFLIDDYILMTNNHVLPNINVAKKTKIEFNYQLDSKGDLLPTYRYEIDPNYFFTNENLDYTIVRFFPDPRKPISKEWGKLLLNPNADPIPNEHVSIIQHPNGGLKQIVLTSNLVINSESYKLRYTTDTLSGSSGSPVFNDSWHVIAIHHATIPSQNNRYNYLNEGILISYIKADCGEFWPK